MDASFLQNEFNNYFHAFKAPKLQPNVENSVGTETSVDIRALIEKKSTVDSGVKVTVTPKAELMPDKGDDQVHTYITETGNIIRKDMVGGGMSSDPLSQRITMVAAQSNIEVPEEETMSALLDKASSRNIDIAGIADLSGFGHDQVISGTFRSKTELGEFNGSGMVVSEDGEVVGYLVKEGKPLRNSSESALTLSITSDRGNNISIDVSVLDQYNRYFQPDADKRHIGVARDLEISFRSDMALNDAERESIDKALEALNPLMNSFHENLSVRSDDLSDLTDLADVSDSGISSMKLKLSTYDGAHAISLEKSEGNPPAILTKEVSDDIYREQARNYSFSASSIGKYDNEVSEKLWSDITYESDSEWRRDIISDSPQNFDYSTRALIASTFG